jgi:hypothetical protein
VLLVTGHANVRPRRRQSEGGSVVTLLQQNMEQQECGVGHDIRGGIEQQPLASRCCKPMKLRVRRTRLPLRVDRYFAARREKGIDRLIRLIY